MLLHASHKIVLLTVIAQYILAAPQSLSKRDHTNSLPALAAPSQGRKPEHKTYGKHGAVATEVDVCSNIGADLIAAGGSAADAIIGASLCVGSIDAFHSGIGGGGFILVRKANKDGNHVVETIDMREEAPAASTETMYSDNPDKNASTIGGLAVGIPGELRGYHYLHQRFGKLPWAQLFEPSIKLNREGFAVPSQLNTSIAAYADKLMCKDPLFKEVYCASGKAAKLGDVIKRERLATTYEIIAKDGPDGFYKGPIAERTIKAAKDRGGILTLEDLANYRAKIRQAFSIDFDEKRRVWSTSAPSSGVVVLSALKTMSEYNKEDHPSVAGVNLTTHRLIEATKFAYGERTEYADPDYVKNVTSLERNSLTDKDAKIKRDRIKDDATEPPSYYDPQSYTVLTDHGTSELAAQDDDGLAITLTTTVNLLWGSQIMTPDGFILNDEMDDFGSPGSSNAFGFRPSSANFIRPGKRPLSSISPVIIEDIESGRTTHALGCAGGSRIISTNIINTFKALQGEDLQAAIDMPRWHDQLLPATTTFEWQDTSSPSIPGWKGFGNSTVAFLKSVGHNISFVAPGLSTAQGVYFAEHNGEYKGATEIRQLAARSAAV